MRQGLPWAVSVRLLGALLGDCGVRSPDGPGGLLGQRGDCGSTGTRADSAVRVPAACAVVSSAPAGCRGRVPPSVVTHPVLFEHHETTQP